MFIYRTAELRLLEKSLQSLADPTRQREQFPSRGPGKEALAENMDLGSSLNQRRRSPRSKAVRLWWRKKQPYSLP